MLPWMCKIAYHYNFKLEKNAGVYIYIPSLLTVPPPIKQCHNKSSLLLVWLEHTKHTAPYTVCKENMHKPQANI